MRGMVAVARIAGLSADTACKDWTRLFRFPRVKRADKPPAEQRTQEQPYFRMSWGCVNIHAREMQTPNHVMAYPGTLTSPLSQMALAEFSASDLAQGCLHDFRGRIGVDPGESRSGMANIRVGDAGATEPEIEREIIQYLPDGVSPIKPTKPTARALRARRLIEALVNPRAKDAKPLAAAQHAFGCLYENRPIFASEQEGNGWHAGAYTLAANVCYCLRNELGEHEGAMTPQFIFALLLTPARLSNDLRVKALRPDARSNETVSTELWSIVKSVYRRFRFQRDLTQQEKDDQERQQVADAEAQTMAQAEAENLIKASMLNMVIEGIPGERDREASRQRAVNPAANESWASAWVNANWRKHLILSCPKEGRAVVTILPGGKVVYGKMESKDEGLYTGIRDCGHNLIVDTKPAAVPGEPPMLLPVPQIMRENGSSCSIALSRIIDSPALRIMRTNDGANVTYLGRALGMRTDIEAVPDPAVEAWLHAMAGDNIEKLLDWLACYMRIDQPIAGLYLEGAPGVGKGMLTDALSYMTEAGISAPFSQVVDQFQDDMILSPFVLGDEEGTSAHGSARSPMNRYKTFVTSNKISLNGKNKTPVNIEGYWRVMFTANNDKLLEWKGDVNEQDLGAMIVRTLHVLCDEGASKGFLKKIGGKEGTKGWPEKNIPQHIMWLTQTRKVIPGERLLVEGVRSNYHDDMALNTIATQLVVCAIGEMLRSDMNIYQEVVFPRKDHEGKWHMYLVLGNLRNAMVDLFKNDSATKVPQKGSIRESVKTLSLKGSDTPAHMTIKGKRTSVRLWALNMPHILKSLKRLGDVLDLRQGMGKEAWEALVPADIRDEVEHVDPAQFAPMTPPIQRAPAPPIQFPAATAYGSSSNTPPPPPRGAPPWPSAAKAKE